MIIYESKKVIKANGKKQENGSKFYKRWGMYMLERFDKFDFIQAIYKLCEFIVEH